MLGGRSQEHQTTSGKCCYSRSNSIQLHIQQARWCSYILIVPHFVGCRWLFSRTNKFIFMSVTSNTPVSEECVCVCATSLCIHFSSPKRHISILICSHQHSSLRTKMSILSYDAKIMIESIPTSLKCNQLIYLFFFFCVNVFVPSFCDTFDREAVLSRCHRML